MSEHSNAPKGEVSLYAQGDPADYQAVMKAWLPDFSRQVEPQELDTRQRSLWGPEQLELAFE